MRAPHHELVLFQQIKNCFCCVPQNEIEGDILGYTTSHDKNNQTSEFIQSVVSVTKEINQNLTPAQNKLLKWHFILCHVILQHVLWLVRNCHAKLKGCTKSIYNCVILRCVAFKCRKYHLHTSKSKKVVIIPGKEVELKKYYLHPVEIVSADRYELKL